MRIIYVHHREGESMETEGGYIFIHTVVLTSAVTQRYPTIEAEVQGE